MSAIKQVKNLTRHILRPKRLNTVVFFVTSVCNEKCRHCFYWEELNQKGDLTFDEIRKISETMPAISDLWLSGGEPFMRKELAEILELFYRNNNVRCVNLPTNGLFTERAHRCLDRVLANCPELQLDLNVSVDGFEVTHERIRGVPGCYRKTLEMIRSLPPLVEKYRQRLRANVNTCLNAENADEIIAFMKFVYEELPVDGQYLQLIRGNVMDASLKQIPLGKVREIYEYARRLYDCYAERMFRSLSWPSRQAFKVAYSGTLAFHNKIQYANYLQSTRWPMPCTAGETFCVIDYNGDVRACELRDKVANLRDYGFDFSRFWSDSLRKNETHQIVCDQCWCTHVCNIHDSARYSPKALMIDIPFTYFETHSDT